MKSHHFQSYLFLLPAQMQLQGFAMMCFGFPRIKVPSREHFANFHDEKSASDLTLSESCSGRGRNSARFAFRIRSGGVAKRRVPASAASLSEKCTFALRGTESRFARRADDAAVVARRTKPRRTGGG